MTLFPYTVTALAESDAEGTDGKNIVVGATVTATDELEQQVVMYDNAEGSTPATQKVTGARGQVTIYLEAGIYKITTNSINEIWITLGVGGSVQAESTQGQEGLYLIAHRGFIDIFPQNTMIAMTSAIRRGADALECDAAYSADGTGYLFHDTTVDALTDGTGTFTSLSDAYINTLRFPSLSGSIINDVGIPTFESFVRYAAEARVKIVVEIKRISSNANIDDMVNIIQSYKMSDKTVLASFNFSDIEYVRQLDQVIEVAFLSSSTTQTAYESQITDLAGLGRAWAIWRGTSLVSVPAIIDFAKSLDVTVAAYTINDLNDAKELMRLGVKNLVSDINLETL